MIALSKEILERVDRVLDYHRVSQHTPQSIVRLKPQTGPAAQPSPVRVFPGLPKVALPTNILDIPVPAVEVVRGVPQRSPKRSSARRRCRSIFNRAHSGSTDRRPTTSPCSSKKCRA